MMKMSDYYLRVHFITKEEYEEGLQIPFCKVVTKPYKHGYLRVVCPQSYTDEMIGLLFDTYNIQLNMKGDEVCE